tara:strand:- start:818 stop:1165 length:348 start_codon:yes stop_codon:yes gene_type:complete
LANIPEISIDELAELNLEKICLVDVREKYEFIEMRVPGAKLLPLSEVPENLAAFPSDSPVYLICASGNRSGVAGDFLAGHKIDAINVAGGTKGWVMSGNVYVQGDDDLPLFVGQE